jgi:proline dehydrogenase
MAKYRDKSHKPISLSLKRFHHPMVSFDNTEIAFSGKTQQDLNRSYWLFKMVSNPGVVKFGKTMTDFALKTHLPIRGLIKATIFRQFVGGEDIQECKRTIAELGKYRIGTILDYSVEGAETEEAFDACTKETLETVELAASNSHIPFCVFKVTGLARFALLEKVSLGGLLHESEKNEYEKVKQRVLDICTKASEAGVPVFIDAEESWIQPAVDEMAVSMMARFNKTRPLVYNTFQLYLKKRLDYLQKSLSAAEAGGYLLGAKLVRGAYMEKERARAAEQNYPSPIQDNKAETDHDYNSALEFCLSHINHIGFCAGTHNEESSMHLVKLMEKNNVPHNHPHICFSQLFGMSDHISFNLAKDGYLVAKYVPYGPVREVLPYLIRRAQENTSVKGQTGRELSLIIKEKERRQKSRV